jgi:hypothetical protein
MARAAAAQAQAAASAEMAAAAAEAAREGVGARPGAASDAEGRVVITGRDGQTIVLDARAVPQTQIDQYVEQALAPEPPYVEHGPPPGVIELVGIVMSLITLMVLGVPLIRAWTRRLERKQVAPAAPSDVGDRLERIEQAVEAVALEMERVAEAQRFSARLLSERLPDALPLLDARASARRETAHAAGEQ